MKINRGTKKLLKKALSDITDFSLGHSTDTEIPQEDVIDCLNKVETAVSCALKIIDEDEGKFVNMSYYFDQFTNYLERQLSDKTIVILDLFNSIAQEAEAEEQIILQRKAEAYSNNTDALFQDLREMVNNTSLDNLRMYSNDRRESKDEE